MEAEVRARIQSLADTVVARQQGRALAAQALGFSNGHLTIIAIAISGRARNISNFVQLLVSSMAA
jgi:hypothetical protein